MFARDVINKQTLSLCAIQLKFNLKDRFYSSRARQRDLYIDEGGDQWSDSSSFKGSQVSLNRE